MSKQTTKVLFDGALEVKGSEPWGFKVQISESEPPSGCPQHSHRIEVQKHGSATFERVTSPHQLLALLRDDLVTP